MIGYVDSACAEERRSVEEEMSDAMFRLSVVDSTWTLLVFHQGQERYLIALSASIRSDHLK